MPFMLTESSPSIMRRPATPAIGLPAMGARSICAVASPILPMLPPIPPPIMPRPPRAAASFPSTPSRAAYPFAVALSWGADSAAVMGTSAAGAAAAPWG